jgi:hypothetical protein
MLSFRNLETYPWEFSQRIELIRIIQSNAMQGREVELVNSSCLSFYYRQS